MCRDRPAHLRTHRAQATNYLSPDLLRKPKGSTEIQGTKR